MQLLRPWRWRCPWRSHCFALPGTRPARPCHHPPSCSSTGAFPVEHPHHLAWHTPLLRFNNITLAVCSTFLLPIFYFRVLVAPELFARHAPCKNQSRWSFMILFMDKWINVMSCGFNLSGRRAIMVQVLHPASHGDFVRRNAACRCEG